MCDIVSGVLKHTFGFFANKIRKEVAERLKDSDVTDEECRLLIIKELENIKSKLDGLARKDLLSGLCFLQEGVSHLHESLLQFASDANTAESTEGATVVEASLSTALVHFSPSPVNDAVAPVSAVTTLQLHSSEHFKSAIKSFELAREKATEAFCNEALSIEDRVQASQIRMMARILENLEHPDAGVSDCLQYLNQLHNTGAVREIFAVLMAGGLKSWFNRTKRLENASSVHVMNQLLFDFSRKFAQTNSMLPIVFCWPMILVGTKIYNPVFGEEKLVKKLKEAGLQVLSPCPDFTFSDKINPKCSVVNRKREIVANLWKLKTIKIFKRSGESRTLCEVPMEEHVSNCDVIAMDIDAKDNIYVITAFQESDDQTWGFKLFILDGNGDKKLETLLDFLARSRDWNAVRLAIIGDGRIAILNYTGQMIYFGKVCVEMNSFEDEIKAGLCVTRLDPAFGFTSIIRFLDSHVTKLIVCELHTIYIFILEIGLPLFQITIPDENRFVLGVAVDHVTKRILVLTSNKDFPSLLSYSESGELLHISYFGSVIQNVTHPWSKLQTTNLISHPSGSVALVNDKEAILLQW